KTNLDGLSLKSGNTPFADWNRYPNRLCVCNNIFIGIGTCIPRVELDVIGTGYLSKLAIGNINPTNLENRYFYLKTSSQTEANQAIFTIENNDRKIFQIENNGLIWCREIKLNQTWADYVFDNNYKLMPLKELENFIIHNKHLPNIPSAQVIEKEGITVNETNRILLEKIEELTLYVIQQQKEIEELKEKLIK
ncbi:MAG: hypothetical protein HYU67_12140, partial [Flavobacteriia bacterium]|nr:hypothetical protein [Flavobacteriia bacterium]